MVASMDEHQFSNDRIAATVRAHGAEPTSLRESVAGEVLWQAGPAWPRHAPVLFPIVGELAGGAFRHEGRTYALGRHGFARECDFAWTERSTGACTLELRDDARTRTQYPFAFVLSIRYALEASTLVVTYTVRNPGQTALPASLGAHPAFRWPLAEGVAKEAHALVFARDEPERVRRLDKNLLSPEGFDSPIVGRTLALRPALFEADAIVMDRPNSDAVRYAAPGAPSIEIAWTGFEQLGLWSKTGGDFLCIEPWYGYASPAGFTGDFADKPGLMHVPPGEERIFTMRVTVNAAESSRQSTA